MQQYVSIVTKNSVQLSPPFPTSVFYSLICPPYSEPYTFPSPHPFMLNIYRLNLGTGQQYIPQLRIMPFQRSVGQHSFESKRINKHK